MSTPVVFSTPTPREAEYLSVITHNSDTVPTWLIYDGIDCHVYQGAAARVLDELSGQEDFDALYSWPTRNHGIPILIRLVRGWTVGITGEADSPLRFRPSRDSPEEEFRLLYDPADADAWIDFRTWQFVTYGQMPVMIPAMAIYGYSDGALQVHVSEASGELISLTVPRDGVVWSALPAPDVGVGNGEGVAQTERWQRLGGAVDAVLAQANERKDLVNWTMVPRDAINDLRAARAETKRG